GSGTPTHWFSTELSEQSLPLKPDCVTPVPDPSGGDRTDALHWCLSSESESSWLVGSYCVCRLFNEMCGPAPRPANVPFPCLSKPNIPKCKGQRFRAPPVYHIPPQAGGHHPRNPRGRHPYAYPLHLYLSASLYAVYSVVTSLPTPPSCASETHVLFLGR